MTDIKKPNTLGILDMDKFYVQSLNNVLGYLNRIEKDIKELEDKKEMYKQELFDLYEQLTDKTLFRSKYTI